MKETWIICSLVVLTLTTVTSADLCAPGDLNPGETFRWIFKTSSVTDAYANTSAYYDTFVTNAALNDGSDVHNVLGVSNIGDITWKAIVSTRAGQTAAAHIGEFTGEVYNTQSDIVAHSSADLFDGSLENSVKYDESGGLTPLGTRDVWTGSIYTGEADSYGGLGPGQAAVGDSLATDTSWLNRAYTSAGEEYSVYAISEELTVVPLPSAGILGFIGMATSSLALRKRRKKTVATESAL